MIALPETGELSGHRFWLTLLPDHHFIQEPAAAPTSAVMADAHSAHPTQGHGLDEKLIVLNGGQRENLLKILAGYFIIFVECLCTL